MDDLNKDFKKVSVSEFAYSLGLGLPTFDWNELKKAREQDFLKYKNEANLMNGIEPENDNFIYQKWLEREKENANKWKSNHKEKNSGLIYENDISQIDKYICFLEQELSKAKDNTIKLKIKTSYIWQGKDKELPELYNLMRDKYKLIASDTTFEQFKAVFTGQPLDDRFEPIRWHQDNASELLYFIDRLEQSDNIQNNPKRADYMKLKACFVKPDGKQFKAVWKSLKTNIDINLSSDKQKAIDELVSSF